MPISRLLIANRGEIAVRIIRACRDLGIETVLACSEADRDSLPSRMADRVVCVGPARASESYLNVQAMLATAQGVGADAIHPGYGFLSEDPALAEGCELAGVTFVGPHPDIIRRMGNKVSAKEVAARSGVETVPGSEAVVTLGEAAEAAKAIGFPLLLKARSGGGGRGIKLVDSMPKLRVVFDTASAEARASFGDGALYLERYLENARHIEVQLVGDHSGNAIHLGSRDCSVQRRYQKVIEEAPASSVTPGSARAMADSALAIARSLSYDSVGTVEFAYDQDADEFYFLEMNTRIQVEHPVTEAVTNVDLVREQIEIAGGRPLSLTESNSVASGHALECRITAESPERGFSPSPGRITDWSTPSGPGVRVDSHCYAGYLLPPYYDSLLAKLIVHSDNRAGAIDKMLEALGAFAIGGVATTTAFLVGVVGDNDFRENRISTRWLEETKLGPMTSKRPLLVQDVP